MKRSIALAKSDIKISLRRGEALILNLLFPIVFLFIINRNTNNAEEALCFAFVLVTMSTSMSSLGIMTGFERRFRVLVRLGTTPLSKKELILSKILSVLLLQTFYFAVLGVIALFIGWSPSPEWILAPVVCWVASFNFAGISLLIAGQIKAETNLAIQNLIYFLFAGLASIALMRNPSTLLEYIGQVSPSGGLHYALRWISNLNSSLNNNLSNVNVALIILVIGSIVWPLLAARFFTFDEA